jgi:hypothetical protein
MWVVLGQACHRMCPCTFFGKQLIKSRKDQVYTLCGIMALYFALHRLQGHSSLIKRNAARLHDMPLLSP